MTYQEFIAKKETLARVEKEYLETWKSIPDKRKRSKKLSRLALELSALQDEIMTSKFYK